MQMSHYAELDNRYEMSRKIIHDFKKHLCTLGELKNRDNEKAYDYETMVENEIDSLFMCFKCSNKVLSIVMSQKIALAERNKIKVITDVDKNHILSTKNNHIGVGLSIIKSVTEKNGGLFVEEHTDSEFKIEITFPNQSLI